MPFACFAPFAHSALNSIFALSTEKKHNKNAIEYRSPRASPMWPMCISGNKSIQSTQLIHNAHHPLFGWLSSRWWRWWWPLLYGVSIWLYHLPSWVCVCVCLFRLLCFRLLGWLLLIFTVYACRSVCNDGHSGLVVSSRITHTHRLANSKCIRMTLRPVQQAHANVFWKDEVMHRHLRPHCHHWNGTRHLPLFTADAYESGIRVPHFCLLPWEAPKEKP